MGAVVDKYNDFVDYFEKKELPIVYVDKDLEEKEKKQWSLPFKKKKITGLSLAIFRKEWRPFKHFCHKNQISHELVVETFFKYVDVDIGAYLNFPVETDRVYSFWQRESNINRDVADVYVWYIFSKDNQKLEYNHDNKMCTFPRFLMMAHIFCSQSLPDLIFDFMCCLRTRVYVKPKAVMFTYNFQKIVEMLTEDIQDSMALRIIINACNVRNDDYISITKCIRLGLKYPLYFLPLLWWQRLFRRKFLGDKYWEGRKKMVPQLDLGLGGVVNLRHNSSFWNDFESEAAATRQTARALITDIANIEYFVSDEVKEQQEFELYLSRLDEEDRRAALEYEAAKKASKAEATLEFYSKNPYHVSREHVRIFEIESIEIHDTFYPTVTSISKETMYRLKYFLGYRTAKALVTESELPLEEDFDMMAPLSEGRGPERAYDETMRAEYLLDVSTGQKGWVRKVVDRQGKTLREYVSFGEPSRAEKVQEGKYYECYDELYEEFW
jgi:hypothetical protein